MRPRRARSSRRAAQLLKELAAGARIPRSHAPMADKYCFMNAQRPCDLTCKAAFEVDDPVDNIDCSFVWLAFHFGEGVLEMRRTFEGGSEAGGPGTVPGGGPAPKGPKGVSNN